MKKIFVTLGLLIVGGLAYYFFVGNNNQQSTYLTEKVTRGNIEKTVVASGSISSINEVDVGAQVSGKITRLYVILGQEVKKGDLIADIDSTTQINALNTKKAALASYQAQLKAKETALSVAQSAYSRYSKLYGQKATSLDELNNAKNTFDAAKSEVDALKESIKQAEIEVNTAETNVGYTQITSPIDGTIISTPISEGQTVNSAQTTPTIVTVADLNKMLVKPEISEGDITKVKAGQAVSFTILSDPNTHYKSVISSVDPATTTKSDNTSTSSSNSSTSSSTSAVYYYANLIVDNPDRTLRIGMTTENNIKIADAQNVLLVSNMAIQKREGKTFVNVLNENNQPEMREVEIGVQNDFQTEIKSGLVEGDKVIVSQVAVGEQVGNSGRGPRMF
ncbi:efflux RND transporter periplasmic adaptor subunit [Rodentibacter pneumotropicus]|uniref:efflux RND transporter periplasmic adaptor subunit n=1 Tax=Rodentibacter pneumotropicus TaxID=758 RepID=UPI00035E2CDF|nr:efflux RND transporter periplasmic adaptor subunit [Rodentibacter pneumotropicus]NBH74848.1 efflux RND transporter periplasmic adaptor subunit [Rodentibacter pneumotropicus]OOF60790.1 efflux transporter periplasmic adaptor subunit [Rodentibacter pneumotropicus]THA01934.1 efflux RND transporter periplasmic adaptor subunit [Rodentibacter pneumotropicus]THA05775.1 efflux RND transporter periplasmic adaptor subunit [Rodentibacter pneumotropicus]THA12693.1 efflux RND transporter periplasmic adap